MNELFSVRALRLHGVGVLAVAALVFASAGLTRANDYYVAPTGSDTNPGTIDQPFATLKKGASAAMPGDTVYLRGGTYHIVEPDSTNAGIAITESGTSDTDRIRFWAYPGETPVFDFADLKISTTTYTNGFTVSGSYLHFKGLEIKNVPMHMYSNNGMSVSNASHDIFELINFHHNNGTGLFIGKGTGGHRVLNCDSHDNYDPTSNQGDGQNADGFGLHYQTAGAVSTFSGCRAWWNSDDGYDFINQEISGVIENSWAMGNGYINSGSARPGAGNGSGFKVGSSKTGVRHTVRNNLAWKNVANGFYANHSSGGNDWYNNTSYNNGMQFNMLASDPNDSATTIILMGDRVHHMRNNLSFPNRTSNMGGVDAASNTWDLSLTAAAADFTSVDDSGFMGARQADGSLPDIDFMRLRAQSPLIDKGTDVGLPFAGAAPDLGSFEAGLASSSGSSAAAGSSATGGAPASAGTSAGRTAAGSSGVGSGGVSGTTRNASGAGPSANSSAGDGGRFGSAEERSAAAGATTPTAPTDVASAAGCGCSVRSRRTQSETLSWYGSAGTIALLLARRRATRRNNGWDVTTH